MIPIVFDGCFGWFHPGRGARGIILCAAFGHENMIAHRGWRQLAEDLASEGFHVIRYDYPFTGDSSDAQDYPDLLECWQSSIVSAVNYLQTVSEAREIILVGLQLGATLALRTLSNLSQVKGVACLAPVLSGKSYVRELRLRARAWHEANLIASDQDLRDGFDVLGDRLEAVTVRHLKEIDIRDLSLNPKHILFMTTASGSSIVAALDHLRLQGCELTWKDFSGYHEFLEGSISSRIPVEAFTALVGWCDQTLPPQRCCIPTVIGTASSDLPGVGVLRLPDAIEHPVRFGPSSGLFGVLCTPRSGRGVMMNPVVMINTGFGRHTGDGRMFTTLARRLASAEVTSLRMDLADFGDSHASMKSDPDPYSETASLDVKAAVDFLAQAGYRDIVLVGICSGAFTAFHATIQEPRVRGLVMVNIQTFIWRSGLSLKVQNKRQRRPLGFYYRAATRLASWRRVFRGQVALVPLVTALCQRPLIAARHRLLVLIEQMSGRQTSAGQVMRWFCSLDARSVQVRLLYSEGDPGLAELSLQLGRSAARVRRSENIQYHTLGPADHALLDHNARLKFVQMVLDFVKGLRDRDTAQAGSL